MREEIKISHVINTVHCYGKVQTNDFYVIQFTLTKLITVYVPIRKKDKECLRKKIRSAADPDETAIDT